MRLERWLLEGLFCSSVGRPENVSMQMAEEIREGRFGKEKEKCGAGQAGTAWAILKMWKMTSFCFVFLGGR